MIHDNDGWKQRICHDSSPDEKLISLVERRNSLSRQKDQTIARRSCVYKLPSHLCPSVYRCSLRMAPSPAVPTPLASDSASAPEKNARNASTAKLRSCVVCRSRKVRCDKLSPCSNCRKANIPCVVPSNDRPPRWARRLERIADNGQGVAGQGAGGSGTDQVMNRLRTLENLVKELSGQLEVANAAASRGASSDAPSPQDVVKDAASPSSTSTASDVQKHFGRMVIKDKNREKYVASGFWSRISDEVRQLQPCFFLFIALTACSSMG